MSCRRARRHEGMVRTRDAVCRAAAHPGCTALSGRRVGNKNNPFAYPSEHSQREAAPGRGRGAGRARPRDPQQTQTQLSHVSASPLRRASSTHDGFIVYSSNYKNLMCFPKCPRIYNKSCRKTYKDTRTVHRRCPPSPLGARSRTLVCLADTDYTGVCVCVERAVRTR